MHRFEPPPLPGEHRSAAEPTDPYATSTSSSTPQASGYGAPSQAYGYDYGAAPQAAWGTPALNNHPRGTTVLVLGILSLVLLPLLGPVAWVMGRSALKEADASPQPVSNRSSLVAGMVMGIIGTVLLVLGTLTFVVFFFAIVTMSAAPVV